MAESHINGLPIWARVVIYLGAPTALASFLLFVGYQLGGIFLKDYARLIVETHAYARAEIENMQILKASFGAQTNILRAICINQAKDEDGRNRCLAEGDFRR